MKIPVAVALLCIAAFFVGRLSVVYSVPALALDDLRVVCTSYKEPRKEDLSDVRRFLERAWWTNGSSSWKWPTDFVLKDGRKLRIDELTGVFTLDGTPGYYQIQEEDQVAFRQAITTRTAKRLKQPNKALEPTTTAVTSPACAGAAPAVVVAHL